MAYPALSSPKNLERITLRNYMQQVHAALDATPLVEANIVKACWNLKLYIKQYELDTNDLKCLEDWQQRRLSQEPNVMLTDTLTRAIIALYKNSITASDNTIFEQAINEMEPLIAPSVYRVLHYLLDMLAAEFSLRYKDETRIANKILSKYSAHPFRQEALFIDRKYRLDNLPTLLGWKPAFAYPDDAFKSAQYIHNPDEKQAEMEFLMYQGNLFACYEYASKLVDISQKKLYYEHIKCRARNDLYYGDTQLNRLCQVHQRVVYRPRFATVGVHDVLS